MLKLLKFLPALLKFRDVSGAYREAEGEDKPFYVSKRFVGGVIGLIVAVAVVVMSQFFGVTVSVSPKDIGTITEAFVAFFAAFGSIYAAVMMVIGQIQKNKRIH